jgi:hypothetical protein
MQPVSDTRSKLVLRKSQVMTSADFKVKYLDFEHQGSIAFNRSYPFRMQVSKDIQPANLRITFNFEIEEGQAAGVNSEPLLHFRNPNELTLLASLDVNKMVKAKKPPVIQVLSPPLNTDGKRIVKEATIDIVGFTEGEGGINLVLVNSVDARMYPDGKFVSPVKLAPGDNEIRIMAVDNEGSITEQKINVLCESFSLATQMLNAGKYYALLIAVEQYEDPKISDLDHSIDDATALHDVLIRYYSFDKERVKMLINPRFEDMVIELDRLNNLVTGQDNLLIFYAGHGIWSEQSKVGYWLPSDARESNTANWFRNSTLRDYIGSISSKHTLLIADACFSGSIFKSRSAFANAPAAIEKVYELPSRKAMTSGSLSEVPDKSVFLEYLIKRLSDNDKAYLTSEELFYSMKSAIINNGPTIPQYGEILNTGDEGGDFVFIRKR